MKKKRDGFLLLLAMLCTWAGAQAADGVAYVLRVARVGGAVDTYMLSKHPQVVYNANMISIYTEDDWFGTGYHLDEVVDFTFADAATAIEAPESDPADTKAGLTVRFTDGETVVISGTDEDGQVSVSSTDGKAQPASVTPQQGGATVSLAQLPKGIYIISVRQPGTGNVQSIKVMKR